MLEGGLAGLTDLNAGLEVENISYDAVVGMLVLDFVLYSIIGWYLDKVLHSEQGGRQPLYFLCTSTFWRGKRKHHYPPCKEPHPELSVCVEHVPYELRSQVNDKRYARPAALCCAVQISLALTGLVLAGCRCIEIAGLSKAFGRGRFRKVAVDDVHLELYENQVRLIVARFLSSWSELTMSLLLWLLSSRLLSCWGTTALASPR